MAELSFYLPRTDYMHRDDYDLLDSILISLGFYDSGVVEVSDHTFRKYVGDTKIFEFALAQSTVATRFNYGNRQLALYMSSSIDEIMRLSLAVFGIYFVDMATIGDQVFHQYAIDPHNLPFLARFCRDEVKASKRVVEEHAYYKFANRGYGHGSDWSDWFQAEWEANDRINDLLESLTKYLH